MLPFQRITFCSGTSSDDFFFLICDKLFHLFYLLKFESMQTGCLRFKPFFYETFTAWVKASLETTAHVLLQDHLKQKGPLINIFTHVMVRASSKAVILPWFPGVIPGSSLQLWSCLSALSEMLPSTVCHLRGKLTVQTFWSPFLDFNSSFWIDTPR